MNGDALPSELDRTRAAIALLTVLRGEGITEARRYHDQLLLLAHTAAVCAVALSVDLSLLQTIFVARYWALHRVWPVVARIPLGDLQELTTPELVRVTHKLVGALDAITREPSSHVWFAIHAYAGHGLQHGAPLGVLLDLLGNRHRAALETIENEAKKGGKA
jgi:hypothetical protein